MKVFYIDEQVWELSDCGQFCRMIIGPDNTGWFQLSQFNDRFRAIANNAV